jgi:hypothetical protein
MIGIMPIDYLIKSITQQKKTLEKPEFDQKQFII